MRRTRARAGKVSTWPIRASDSHAYTHPGRPEQILAGRGAGAIVSEALSRGAMKRMILWHMAGGPRADGGVLFEAVFWSTEDGIATNRLLIEISL